MRDSWRYTAAGTDSQLVNEDGAKLDVRFWFLLFAGHICLASSAWPNQLIGAVLVAAFLYVAFRHLAEFQHTSLRFAAWRPAEARYWRLAVLTGAAAGSAVCVGAAMTGQRLLGPAPWSTIILQCALGPVLEEMVFRGYFFHVARPVVKRPRREAASWIIVAASALLFAGFHLLRARLSWVELLAITLTGTAFGYLRLRSGSTAPAAAAHAIYNICIVAGGVFT